MESKIKDNRKLTKYLVISGITVLLLVFVIRMLSMVGKDRIMDMPQIGELPYDPKPEKPLSKIEQFEKERAEKENPKTEDIIPLPKFILDSSSKKQQNKSENIQEVITKAPSQKHYTRSNSTINQSTETVIKKSSGGKIFEYKSDYITKKEERNINEEPIETKTNKNPFGTIGSSGKEIKNESNTAIFYSAEIYGDQKIENGGNVLIRNTEAISYNTISIPRNSVLYGQAKFSGNRVHVIVNRAKTSKGEYAVNLAVQDNDRIEGLYYKAAIDETIDKQKEEIEVNLPGKFGILNKVTEQAISGGKDLMRRSQTLNLNEGYKLFIIPNNQ